MNQSITSAGQGRGHHHPIARSWHGMYAGAILAAAASVAGAAVTIPTNLGNGADCEVREASGDTNRGTSTELASRIVDNFPAGDVNNGSDRSSLMYLKFDISGLTSADLASNPNAGVSLTYRNNSLSEGRIVQTVGDVTKHAGLQYYGLDINDAGNSWGETTLTYNNAPGLAPDGNAGTQDYDLSKLTFLGSQELPDVGSQNHLPVGGQFLFNSPAVHDFVASAVSAGKGSVTFVVGLTQDGDSAFNNLTNFNYLFNPKEMVTLNDDSGYDADVNDPLNPVGGPFSGADNSTGAFSPSLVLSVPEPTSLTLLGLGSLALLRRRRGAR